MRIVAGKHAERRLTSPGKRVRPTSESVRVRWLDRLEGELAGARVLDLFAGSGALGLEALSRGAKSADFVENGAEALHALKANVAALRETKRTRISSTPHTAPRRRIASFASGPNVHSHGSSEWNTLAIRSYRCPVFEAAPASAARPE